MRLSLVLPLAVVLALAACDENRATKSGVAARAPLPAPATPAACPPAPACVPAKAAAAPPSRGHRVARKTKAAASGHVRKRARHTAHRASAAPDYAYRRHDDDLAGGPPPYERQDDGVRVYGGQAFEERDQRYSRRRYDDADRYDDAPPPPPPPGGSPEEQDRRYLEPPPVHDRYSGGRSYHRESGRTRGGVYGERSRYESHSQSESHSAYGDSTFVEQRLDGPCCVAGPRAAGFDGSGFLTWPGKVPARP